MQIRPATPDDVPNIVDTQAATWIDAYPNAALGITAADIREINWRSKIPGWQHMVRSGQYDVWVASDSEAVAGFITVSRTGRFAELYALYVLPERQRQGFGTQLLNIALAQASGMIYLQVAAYNDVAIKFYERHGFETTGAHGAYALPGNKHIPTTQMRRDLDVGSQPNNRRLVTRAELARQSDTRSSTIKWYSEIGLLPFEQAETGRRRYFDLELCKRRLQRIQALQDAGYELAEIKRQLGGPSFSN